MTDYVSFLGGPPIRWDDESVKDEFMSLRGMHAPYGVDIPRKLVPGQYFGNGKYQVVSGDSGQPGWGDFVPPGYTKVGSVGATFTNPPPKTGGQTQQLSPAMLILKRTGDPESESSSQGSVDPVIPFTPFTFDTSNPTKPSDISVGIIPWEARFPTRQGADVQQLLSQQRELQDAISANESLKRKTDMNDMFNSMQKQTNSFMDRISSSGSQPDPANPTNPLTLNSLADDFAALVSSRNSMR